LERWEAALPKDCAKILHVTGAHWLTQNYAEFARLEALKNRRGVVLSPRRQVTPSYGIECADLAVVLGNSFTASTFHYANKPIIRVPISSAYAFDFPEDKDWENARRKFLWLGSHGMVHKGLDLVLEAFAANPDLHLTVCGRPEKEKDFFQCFERELTGLPNVKLEGWVDPGSQIFDRIRRTHGYAIYPSCSEGGGGALIHAMHAGLVPVATCEASVDLGDFGILVTSGRLEDVNASLRVASSHSAKMLAEKSRATWDHVRKEHTHKNFHVKYAEFVSGLVRKLGL
jgi:glycosyltransferase involved in cell wall biosynthesis